ncbi:zinc ribbon domain-containing protein [Haloarcula amylovorans]|uniref:zinc ribbon domain-containing protein n=1 Tax=Haloarcula amylovorans TaxID=2562280 RepID=UPI001076B371|nr:zinc ribbon domain-containing protein [Halomicroarcula amylolytica]
MVDADSIVTGTLATLVAVVVVGLLFLGPVGWLLAALLVLATFVLADFSGVFEEAAKRPRERRNCADCGAPNSVERDTCKHCEAALEDG